MWNETNCQKIKFKMAAVATLSQRMDYLIDQARSKRIVNHDLLNQIFIEVGQLEAPLEARLVEEFQNSLDINEILEEFLNQSLIWVDDVSGRGKLVWFQKLLKTLPQTRDPRGFAVKFYTEEGNWDIVGNNTPIFFIR